MVNNVSQSCFHKSFLQLFDVNLKNIVRIQLVNFLAKLFLGDKMSIFLQTFVLSCN